MRQEVLEYIQAKNLGQFTVSSEIPWTDAGTPLYIKNLRKVYVDNDNVEMEPLVTALDGLSVQQEITTVRVYFANDVKVQPPNYSDVVSEIKTVRNIDTIEGLYRRECDISTSIEQDNQVTEFEFRFYKLIT